MASRAVNLGAWILVFALGWYGYRFLTAGRVDWHTYEEGAALMRSSGKMGFLHFTAQWCVYCRRMEEETFRDSRVADYLNDRFIPMKVQFAQTDPLVSRYGVEAVPDTWIISADGRPVVRLQGYLDSDRLIKGLKRIEEMDRAKPPPER